MGLIPVSTVKRSSADGQATVLASAVEFQAAEAVIAEARAHARRRRLKIALVMIVLAVAAVAAILIGRTVSGTHGTTGSRPRSAALAGPTGIVTGHLAACFGLPPKNPAQAITPGTVVALRGRVTWKQIVPGGWTVQFPKGSIVASQHISNNYDQTFRFALPPGHYVIAGHYDENPAGIYGPFSEVTVTAGAALRVDLPNLCP